MTIHRRERPTIVNLNGTYHVFLTDRYRVNCWLEIARGMDGLEIRYLSDSEVGMMDIPPTKIPIRSPWRLKEVTENGNSGALIAVESQDFGDREYALKMTKDFFSVSPRKRKGCMLDATETPPQFS